MDNNYSSTLRRIRIVGGKKLYVDEEPNWKEIAKNAVESLHACSPISRTWSKQLSTDPTLPSLPPITEKPNNIDPTTYHLKLRQTYQNSGDATSPKIEQPHVSLTSKSTLNSNPVIPAIADTLDRISPQTSSETSDDSLAKYVPSSTFLAPHPITLTKTDELLLRQRISRGLGADFDTETLKEVYTELVEHDEDLTGFVAHTNIGYALLRSQVYLSVMDLRLLSSMYVSTTDERKVDYTKLLSFIAACFKSTDDSRKRYDAGIRHGEHHRTGHRSAHRRRSSLRKSSNQYDSTSEEGDKKRQLSVSSGRSDEESDFSLVRQMFANADEQNKGTMSRETIKILSLAAGLSLKEVEVNRILDKTSSRGCCNVYNWNRYLNEIEKTNALRSKDTLISLRNTKKMSPQQSERRRVPSTRLERGPAQRRDPRGNPVVRGPPTGSRRRTVTAGTVSEVPPGAKDDLRSLAGCDRAIYILVKGWD